MKSKSSVLIRRGPPPAPLRVQRILRNLAEAGDHFGDRVFGSRHSTSDHRNPVLARRCLHRKGPAPLTIDSSGSPPPRGTIRRIQRSFWLTGVRSGPTTLKNASTRRSGAVPTWWGSFQPGPRSSVSSERCWLNSMTWAIARRYTSLESLTQTRIRLIEPDPHQEVTPALQTATGYKQSTRPTRCHSYTTSLDVTLPVSRILPPSLGVRTQTTNTAVIEP